MDLKILGVLAIIVVFVVLLEYHEDKKMKRLAMEVNTVLKMCAVAMLQKKQEEIKEMFEKGLDKI